MVEGPPGDESHLISFSIFLDNKHFPSCAVEWRAKDYGRVQAIICLFSRIVDVEHFNEAILPDLKEEERRELHHRLGILNILNPMKVSSIRARVVHGWWKWLLPRLRDPKSVKEADR